MAETVTNNFESKVSIKIEANSRGFTTSVHCYGGVSKKEIDDTIASSIYAHNELHKRLLPNGDGDKDK